MKRSVIYTQKGDDGRTSLIGGRRVRKNDVRIEAYGTVDELNSWLGRLRAQIAPQVAEHERLRNIQALLFRIGAILATDTAGEAAKESAVRSKMVQSEVTCEEVRQVEEWIDETDALLEPLRAFVTPGDNLLSADAHIARTVCRRAERRIWELTETLAKSEDEKMPPTLLAYINRLSDYLFVLGRYWVTEEAVV